VAHVRRRGRVTVGARALRRRIEAPAAPARPSLAGVCGRRAAAGGWPVTTDETSEAVRCWFPVLFRRTLLPVYLPRSLLDLISKGVK
jgi:hypothetical protein